MSPKVMFTEEDIISAAVSVVEEGGFGDLTVRKVADRLGSSQIPIYSHFSTIEELKSRVLRSVISRIVEYATYRFTDNSFLNIGVGVAVFSREHQNLYQAISSNRDVLVQLLDQFSVMMTSDERLSVFPRRYRQSILNKMLITTCGMAELMAKGILEDTSDEAIIDTLRDIGSAVISAELNKRIADDAREDHE